MSVITQHYMFQFSTLFLLVLISIISSYKSKRDLNLMSSMMISMVLAMTIGMSFGLIFGAFYQGDLFISTIFSVGLGGLAGLLIGTVYGVLPAVEGFFTGLMSGMMGAMLAEMILFQETMILLKLFIMLILCSIMLINLVKETSEERMPSKYLIKPIILIMFFLSYLVSSDLLQTQHYENHPNVDEHKHHNH